MKKLVVILFLTCTSAFSQTLFNEKTQGTMIAKLKMGDSLVYYQCRVVDADVQITTSTQKVEGAKQQITFTEKFVIHLKDSAYSVRYYTSGLTTFPNRRFSGLKIRQKSYWNFTFRNERKLEKKEVQFLALLQNSGREAIEYDFAITKNTTNQIIIKQRKNFEQLLIKEKLSISEALKL